MKKIILFLMIFFLLISCISLVPKDKLREWALSNGYILAEECPKLVVPERQPQPHPSVPTISLIDNDGNEIPITEAYLMEIVIMLFGTVEKYQYLVEIYEREYLNKNNEIMPNLTLDQLKDLYKSKLSIIDKLVPKEPEQPKESPNLSLSSTASKMTIKQLKTFIDAFNYFQEFKKEK